MPIPKNIEREHIFQAIIRIKREGIPALREAKEWAMKYENETYPCKLLISWGNFYANEEELNPNPRNFQTYMAQEYLRNLGFEIIHI
ncbi:hypothetical protein [Flavobacterium sp. TAB 87]|uniref:hypothetical protein n=1 Tax=Flavobacterium sp. TAB 87 TaxID=1729581 RepID=UPI00076BC28D|nr:hypothetical protein [Flavobacterium sp. TAB 87]KVV16045.1 hypothetical protein AP058_00480 [Flavobacterium sp. TAB 87]